MNGPDISRLYEYVILSRREFLVQFRTLGWEGFVKNREASWNSLEGIFIHLLEVDDSWLHYDIAGKPLETATLRFSRASMTSKTMSTISH